MIDLFKGDDTSAFGQDDLLEIEFEIPQGQTCSKMELYIGSIKKTINNPTSPVGIALNSTETKQLQYQNEGYLVMYDGNSKKQTIGCIVEFTANDEVK